MKEGKKSRNQNGPKTHKEARTARRILCALGIVCTILIGHDDGLCMIQCRQVGINVFKMIVGVVIGADEPLVLSIARRLPHAEHMSVFAPQTIVVTRITMRIDQVGDLRVVLNVAVDLNHIQSFVRPPRSSLIGKPVVKAPIDVSSKVNNKLALM